METGGCLEALRGAGSTQKARCAHCHPSLTRSHSAEDAALESSTKTQQGLPRRAFPHLPHHSCFRPPACRQDTSTHGCHQLVFLSGDLSSKHTIRAWGSGAKQLIQSPTLSPPCSPAHTAPLTSILLVRPLSYTAGTGDPQPTVP